MVTLDTKETPDILTLLQIPLTPLSVIIPEELMAQLLVDTLNFPKIILTTLIAVDSLKTATLTHLFLKIKTIETPAEEQEPGVLLMSAKTLIIIPPPIQMSIATLIIMITTALVKETAKDEIKVVFKTTGNHNKTPDNPNPE